MVRLTYCGIRVSELERSLDFYVRVLGLEQVGRGKMQHRGQYVMLQDEKTGQKLELNWYPRNSEFCTEYSVGEGIDHLGFVVDDVKAAFKDLVSKGAAPAVAPWQEVQGDEKSWIGFVKDPDGIWIELINH